MSFTIEIGGVKNVIADLQGLAPAVKDYVINRMSEIAEDSTKAGAARHKRTGTLEKSVYNREVPGGRAVGHDGSFLERSSAGRVNYSYFVLFGTRPHKIAPKNKKALRWVNGGDFVFARMVNHPGYVGDNYLYRAGDEAVAQFRTLIDEGIRRQS